MQTKAGTRTPPCGRANLSRRLSTAVGRASPAVSPRSGSLLAIAGEEDGVFKSGDPYTAGSRGPAARPKRSMALLQMMIVAGEASGDRHAADLAMEIRKRLPEARFFGMGGPLCGAAGVDLVYGAH